MLRFLLLALIALSGPVFAETTLLLDSSDNKTELLRSQQGLERALGSDASLSALARKLKFKTQVQTVGEEFLLRSDPLPDNEGTAALYWRLHHFFPEIIALQSGRSTSVGPTSTSKSSEVPGKEHPEETLMLWFALFAMAITGVLGLYVSSRQIHKIQERHQRILQRHEEIEQRISELFSRLGEDICEMGKEAVDYTSRLLDRTSESRLGSGLKRVVTMESRIVDRANNLLGFLKLKARKVEVRSENFNLNNMLDDVLETLKSTIEPTDVELIFEMDRTLPRYLTGDFVHIGEILSKLLEHSLLYNAGRECKLSMSALNPYIGGMELQIRIYYPPLENEEEGESYFVPVFDEHDGEYRRLGLFVAHELTELLGGSIHMYRHSRRSEVLVDLSIPVQRSDDKEQRKYHLPHRKYIRKEVLIVNQSYEASIALKKMFSYFRHHVTVMELESFEQRRPKLDRYDIFLLDEEILDELLAEYLEKTRKRHELKVVALHNIFRPITPLLHPSVVDIRVNKPLTLERVYSLILELYGERDEEIPVDPEITDSRGFIRDFPEARGVGLESFREFAGATILVVEDNPLNRKMLQKVLEHSGIRVLYAEHGREAVEKMERSAPGEIELVLMDINMPILDGYRATMEIRKLPDGEKLPIVALSALNLENELERMQASGMDGYLPKPLSIGRLYTLFSRYLKEKKEEKEKQRESTRSPVEPPEGIDWKEALRHTNGNEFLLQELLENFIEAYSQSGENLEELFRKREFERMRETLLDLTGLYGSIGATELQKVSKELYRSLILHRLDESETLLKIYEQQFDKLLHSIRKYLKEVG